jgi:hypothetical protein
VGFRWRAPLGSFLWRQSAPSRHCFKALGVPGQCWASAVREIDQALRVAERSADDVALGIAGTALGVALLHRAYEADRERGLELRRY